jgi:hypothetical protein
MSSILRFGIKIRVCNMHAVEYSLLSIAPYVPINERLEKVLVPVES